MTAMLSCCSGYKGVIHHLWHKVDRLNVLLYFVRLFCCDNSNDALLHVLYVCRILFYLISHLFEHAKESYIVVFAHLFSGRPDFS